MSTVKDEIAKNLLYYRKKSGLTQKEFAEKLGVKNTAVSNWESGNNSIDIETLFAACEVFHVTLNDMYGKYSQHGSSRPEISFHAQKIAVAYEKATAKEKKLIDLILADYMQDIPAPVRVAAMSNGGEVDLSGANPDAPLSTGFKSGPDIP